MDKLRFMVLMVDDHIRMSMSELNDEDYLPSPSKSIEGNCALAGFDCIQVRKERRNCCNDKI